MKTTDLCGDSLDYSVMICEGYAYDNDTGLFYRHNEPHYIKRYSTTWELAGPILDREEVGFAKYGPNNTWKAVIGATPRGKPYFGDTALTATMRCFVASRLGDTVDVPQDFR